MVKYLTSYKVTDKENTLVEQKIGVAAVRMKDPLSGISQRTLEQGAKDSQIGFKARNSVLAYQEAFEEALVKPLSLIGPNHYDLNNPRFRAYVESDTFVLFRKLLMETALREGKGGETKLMMIKPTIPKLVNEEAEKMAQIYAEYFGDGNNVCILRSNDYHYAFLSKRTIIAPVKGLDDSALYDWDWNHLTPSEKKQFISWLNQLLSSNASDTLDNLLRAVKVSLRIERTPSDENVSFEERDIELAGHGAVNKEGLSEVKGIFRKIHGEYDLSVINMTKNLACVPSVASVARPDSTDTQMRRLGNSTFLRFSVLSEDEEEMEHYECLVPLTKAATCELEKQGFTLTGGQVTEHEEKLHVKLCLCHERTGADVSIEHTYERSNIKILESFPHIIAKNWLSEEICGGRVQTDLFFYHKIAKEACEPKLEEAEHLDSATRIKILAEEENCSRIPEVFYRSANRNKEQGHFNKYDVYCLKTMPPMLSFCYDEGGYEEEIGCLLTNYNQTSVGMDKNAGVAVDMGTCNTIVTVRYDGNDPKIVFLVSPDNFKSISYIPKTMKAQLEKFYRLSLGYDGMKKTKIRTAALMYPPEAQMKSLVHKEGALFVLNSGTMAILEKEKSDQESASYVETDIKFGGEQRAIVMKTFLRELSYPIVSKLIAQGVTDIEFNVSYPTEGLKDIVKSSWESLVAEMRRWPMVVNNGVTIQTPKLWTEAVAVANYTLHLPGVIANANIGCACIDIGDGTTDISVFTPASGGNQFEFRNQISLKFAGDDILIDTICHMFADQKKTQDRYKELYGQADDVTFDQIWNNDGSSDCKENIERAKSLLAQIAPSTEMYRHAENHEALRNELLTLIEEYGLNKTQLSPQFKALLTMRYATLFYTVANYLKAVLGDTEIFGAFPIYLYGGGSKGMELLNNGSGSFETSEIGVLFRKVIAKTLNCDSAYIKLEMKNTSQKYEVAMGMVKSLHPQLTGRAVIAPEKNPADDEFWDVNFDGFYDDNEDQESVVLSEQENVTDMNMLVNGEQLSPEPVLTPREEFRKVSGLYAAEFVKILVGNADSQLQCSNTLFRRDDSGLLWTYLQSARMLKNKFLRNENNPCYVSVGEHKEIMSILDANRGREYGNTDELPQEIRLRYQAARMVDQYLIKMSTGCCHRD